MPATATIAKVLNRIPPHFSPLEQVAMLMVSDDTPATLRQLAKREVTRAHAARRDHEAGRGVRWSGITTDADPYAVRSVAELVREAEEHEARLSSPRGRFLTALNTLEKFAPADAERVRGIYCRSLADDRHPLDIKAIGSALAILNGVGLAETSAAIDALSELLMTAKAAA